MYRGVLIVVMVCRSFFVFGVGLSFDVVLLLWQKERLREKMAGDSKARALSLAAVIIIVPDVLCCYVTATSDPFFLLDVDDVVVVAVFS